MRKLRKAELGVLVGVVIATGLAHGDENLPEVTITGYQYTPFDWLSQFAGDSPANPPAGSGPAGAYSAKPTAQTNCVVKKLSAAINTNGTIGPNNPAPQPNNTSLPVPIRYDNPIDIIAASSLCSKYGGTPGNNGKPAICIFPSLTAGIWAANYSLGNYAVANYTITQLINVWSDNNPNAMSNTLIGLGISASMANSTYLIDLTASQVNQLVAAFAWQEEFQPSGC